MALAAGPLLTLVPPRPPLPPPPSCRPAASFHRPAASFQCSASPPSSLLASALVPSCAFSVHDGDARAFQRRRRNGGLRAGAEVGRADGTAEPETSAAAAADENGRSGWSGEQDGEKVKALGDSTIYPIMRIYRNDLCTLEVTGDARAAHAIEAMAADGGFTAAEELSKGRSLMTVETIVPGRWEDRSTVSTKLLAPTNVVHKTAKTMWANKKVNMSSGNALARAFQEVVMQHLLSFDIHLRSPGSVRDMSDLANEKEGAVFARLESRDAKVLDGLAEAVCSHSIANIKEDFIRKRSGKSSYSSKISFKRKPEWIWASDRAIGIRSLSDAEIAESAESVLDRQRELGEPRRMYPSWWPPPTSVPSNVLQGEGLSSWTNEFIPIHKLQIDTSKIKVLAKGWQPTNTKLLELHLTHAQMVDLADMMDLYYEDAYTAPPKNLRSNAALQMSPVSQSKVSKALWAALLSVVAGGMFLIGLLVLARLKTSTSGSLPTTFSVASSSPTSDTFTNKWCRVRTDRQPRLPSNAGISAEEMEALCIQVISRLKDTFSLGGQVNSSPDKGAWIGSDLTDPAETQSSTNRVSDSLGGEVGAEQIREADGVEPNSQDSHLGLPPSTIDGSPLLIYQVMVSRRGSVVGFQPGNKLAVNQWASFPFAKELHKRRRLTAGLFETGLKYVELTEDVVAIELLCKTKSSIPAFTARPLRL